MERTDPHGTLNPTWHPEAGERRFVIRVRGHEPDEEAGWKYKLDVYDYKYLDSDGLSIFAIAAGDSWTEAFQTAQHFVETALQTDHCIF